MPKKSKQTKTVQEQEPEVEETTTQVEETTTQVKTFDSLYKSMLAEVAEAYNSVRTVKSNLKNLERLHKREVKMSRKMRKSHNPNKGQKKPSGFNKPTPVPQQIVDLLDLDNGVELPRTKVTKLIYGYIKDHNLQIPEDKRTINPDKQLRKLFGLEKGDQISFYNIQTHIKKLYPTKTTTETVEEVEVDEPVKENNSNQKSKGKKKSKSTHTN